MWDRLSDVCQGQMCLESCVFCGLLFWKHLSPSRISGQRMEKTPVMFLRYIFRRHIVTFSHFIGLLSAKTIYLLGFMMETLANMFFTLTNKQRPGTAIRITFIFIPNCLSGHLWTSELWHIGCSWCWNHVWHQKELFCYWRQWPSGRLHDCPWAWCGCPLVNTKQLLNWLDLP